MICSYLEGDLFSPCCCITGNNTCNEEERDEVPVTDIVTFQRKPTTTPCYGFRDCSVCLEVLYDPYHANRKMTFVLPCGHVFHTDCFRNWNRTRFGNGQAFQCATCSGPALASFFVCADYLCVLCRQSMYKSHQPVIFTIPDKRLVHADCFAMFQLVGRSHYNKQKNIFTRAIKATTSATPKYISYNCSPIDETHPVYLFEDNQQQSLSTFLQRRALLLYSGSTTMETKLETIDHLLSMIVPSRQVTTIGEHFDAVSQSPTRQTAIIALSQSGIIPAASKALKHMEQRNMYDDTSKSFFDKCCLLLATICVGRAESCHALVGSGGFTLLLFRCAYVPEDNRLADLGKVMSAFVFYETQKGGGNAVVVEPTIVQAGGIEAVYTVMRKRLDDPIVQWAGTTFILELAKLTRHRVFNVLRPKWQIQCRERIIRGTALLCDSMNIHKSNQAVKDSIGKLLQCLASPGY